MLTYRDWIFISNVWTELFMLYKIHLLLISMYHPQTNDQTERVNQSLEIYL